MDYSKTNILKFLWNQENTIDKEDPKKVATTVVTFLNRDSIGTIRMMSREVLLNTNTGSKDIKMACLCQF